MPLDRLDNQGRVTIRRELRDRLGARFVQILTPHGLLLRPSHDLLPGEGLSALEADGAQAAAAEASRWQVGRDPTSSSMRKTPR